MIPKPAPSWQAELSDLITDPKELLELLELDPALLPAARRAAAQFGLRTTRNFVARIKPRDPEDPLLRQVLPIVCETAPQPLDFNADPLAEAHSSPVPGLIHKYRSRVLLLGTTQCAINCRYCFRRHFPYAEHRLGRAQFEAAAAYIAAEPAVNEVIFSGGDPLVVGDATLAHQLARLAEIPHLRRVRIHTRLPIVLPSRITAPLVQALTETRLAAVVVIHCNHPQELDPTVTAALAQLRAEGVLLLNQTVLLRGINDRAEVLAELSEALFAGGVLPYYLHLLDRVAGAAHFAVDERRAQALHRDLAALLPGFLTPKLVREEPGAASKTPIGWEALDTAP